MSNNIPANHPFRALLTETLPFEVPIIFSNTQFFNSIRENISDAELKAALKKLRPPVKRYTRPYEYRINKGAGTPRDLAIVHPLQQLVVAEFYERYQSTIVASCARSPFSIRRPSRVSRAFAPEVAPSPEGAYKDGHVEVDRPLTESDAPIVGSYFRYAGYDLVGMFVDSAEYIRLEKRFRLLRQLDIAKCFSNLYTHSVAWSVKDKQIGKKAAGSHSFENEFDTMMQKANYNETNGIVIGPEISRIFCEIILQDVDVKVYRRLKAMDLQEEWDYSIRRYVDDFYIFANSIDRLSLIEEMISEELRKYKLFLNDEKTANEIRPFVTGISAARREIRAEFNRLSMMLRDAEATAAEDLRRRAREVREDVKAIRLIVGKHNAPFHAVSGWILGSLLRTIRRMTADRVHWVSKTLEDEFVDILASLLDLTFYVCAMDSRVRPSYRLGQILLELNKMTDRLEAHNQDTVRHVMAEELIGLVRSARSVSADREQFGDNVELANYLIAGATFIGDDFLNNKIIVEALSGLCSGRVTYFGYITAKYCILKSASAVYSGKLDQINDAVERQILECGIDVVEDAERYLMLCDFLSAPDIEESRKRRLFDRLFGGTLTKAAMSHLVGRTRFADWSGLGVEHLLARKELRPLYE